MLTSRTEFPAPARPGMPMRPAAAAAAAAEGMARGASAPCTLGTDRPGKKGSQELAKGIRPVTGWRRCPSCTQDHRRWRLALALHKAPRPFRSQAQPQAGAWPVHRIGLLTAPTGASCRPVYMRQTAQKLRPPRQTWPSASRACHRTRHGGGHACPFLHADAAQLARTLHQWHRWPGRCTRCHRRRMLLSLGGHLLTRPLNSIYEGHIPPHTASSSSPRCLKGTRPETARLAAPHQHQCPTLGSQPCPVYHLPCQALCGHSCPCGSLPLSQKGARGLAWPVPRGPRRPPVKAWLCGEVVWACRRWGQGQVLSTCGLRNGKGGRETSSCIRRG